MSDVNVQVFRHEGVHGQLVQHVANHTHDELLVG